MMAKFPAAPLAAAPKLAAPKLSAAALSQFLDALATSSNVAASARAAGITAAAVYRRRGHDAAFAARWQAALCDGYARLEEELLAEALLAANGNIKDSTLKARAQRHRLGLALLAAHRAAVRGQAGGAGAAFGGTPAKARLADRLAAMAAAQGDAADMAGDAAAGAAE